MNRYGEQIHGYIEDENGAVICPHCELEMACGERDYLFYCGSGNFGDGHWIAAMEVFANER